jgi:erythritol transport system ATP-binding protein
MVEKMVGPTGPAPERHSAPNADIALSLDRVTLPRAAGGFLVDHVSLNLRAGEVVCLYGLLGAGRSELFECLMGLHPMARGRVELKGRDIAGKSIATRIRRGLVLVPEDRQREGLVQTMSVRENLTLASLRRFTRFLTIGRTRERSAARDMIERLTIKVSSMDVEVTALSGGNQQKVVIGKGLMTEPSVILLDEPSRGVDVGAKAEIFRVMRGLAEAGLGILFSTSDLKEALGYADRIIVMSSGRVAAEFIAAEASETAIVAASSPTFDIERRSA